MRFFSGRDDGDSGMAASCIEGRVRVCGDCYVRCKTSFRGMLGKLLRDLVCSPEQTLRAGEIKDDRTGTRDSTRGAKS